MPRSVVVKKSRHYTGGPGRGLGDKPEVFATAEEALAVAIELTKRNPVGFEVVPYKPVPKDDLPSERAIKNMRRWLDDNEPS